MSSLSTSVGISAEYAGPPKACASPDTNDRHKIGHTCVSPMITSTVSVPALAICTHCDINKIFRRSARSATTPPMSVNKKIGSPARN